MTSLMDFPTEIFQLIVDSIQCPRDVLNLAHTCSSFKTAIYAHDSIWQRLLIKELNISASKFTPFSLEKLTRLDDENSAVKSTCIQSKWMIIFNKLYRHRWAKPAVWIGDRAQCGCFLVSIFDYDKGVFLFHECACSKETRQSFEFSRFSANELIEIHPYNPAVNILDFPLMIIDPDRIDYSKPETLHHLNIYPMHDTIDNDKSYMSTDLLRTRPIAKERIQKSMSLWPPPKIASKNRVRNSSATGFRGQTTPEFPCDDIIRVRTCFPPPRQGSNSSSPWSAGGALSIFRTIQMSKLETFFRLDHEQISSPSRHEPYKGLWMVDLGGAGELLLITHPDNRTLEAIKITADVTVPRGELEFIVHDITKEVGIKYSEWPQSRVVASLWQTSRLCYADATFVESQLILVSSNTLVHYCPDDDSLVYLKRVELDALNGRFNIT